MGSKQNVVRTSTEFYRYNKAIIIMMALLFAASVTFGQTPGLGTWNVINVKENFSKNWNGFFEAQVRSQKFYKDLNYHEYKGGIGYNIAKEFNVTLAAGQYVTYTPTENFDTVTNSEFRLWQQFTLTNNLNRVKLEHRFRIEQRWMSEGYFNRFRYRLNTVIPLNNKKVVEKTIYISVSDEIFLTNTKPHFARNRLFGGLGYMFTDIFTLQAGLLNQYDFDSDGSAYTKNYFQISLLFSLDNSRSDRERHPSTTD